MSFRDETHLPAKQGHLPLGKTKHTMMIRKIRITKLTSLRLGAAGISGFLVNKDDDLVKSDGCFAFLSFLSPAPLSASATWLVAWDFADGPGFCCCFCGWLWSAALPEEGLLGTRLPDGSLLDPAPPLGFQESNSLLLDRLVGASPKLRFNSSASSAMSLSGPQRSISRLSHQILSQDGACEEVRLDCALRFLVSKGPEKMEINNIFCMWL
jgi:hypothetical protein